MKLQAMSCSTTQDGRIWPNMVCWRRKWQPTPLFLPGEFHGQYEKGKRKDPRCPVQWTLIWANSGRQWRTEEPGMIQSMGSQSQTWLGNWTTKGYISPYFCSWFLAWYLVNTNSSYRIKRKWKVVLSRALLKAEMLIYHHPLVTDYLNCRNMQQTEYS